MVAYDPKELERRQLAEIAWLHGCEDMNVIGCIKPTTLVPQVPEDGLALTYAPIHAAATSQGRRPRTARCRGWLTRLAAYFGMKGPQ